MPKVTLGVNVPASVLSTAICVALVTVRFRLVTAVSMASAGPTSTLLPPVNTSPILFNATAFNVVAVTLLVALLLSVMLPAVAVRLTMPAFTT